MVNSLKKICNNDLSLIIYPPGKIDKKNPQASNNYNGQKGDTTCFLYALKIATLYEGIIGNPQSTEHLRAYKKNIISISEINWRRATTLNYVNHIAGECSIDLKSENSKKWVQEITPVVLAAIGEAKKARQGTKEVADVFLKSYLASPVLNVFDFNNEVQRGERIAEVRKFLMSENLKVDELILQKNDFYQKLGFFTSEKLKSQAQAYHVLHEIYIEHVCQLAGFSYADWTPTKPIDDLKKILDEKGALLSAGLMGKGFSENEPGPICKKWNGYTVHGWKSGTFKAKNTSEGHYIILVGASKKDQVVYFIDPADKSSKNEDRKVYVISYKLFCNTVLTKYALQAHGKPLQPEIPNYLLFKVNTDGNRKV